MVWKDNPLPFHPRAKPAATLARYAYKQKGDKGFWDAHDAIFASNPKLEDEDLKGIAEKLGLNWDDVKKAIDTNKFGDRFDASVDLAADLQARGTPHFFINGVRLSGAQPFEAFKKVDRRAARQGQGLVAKGTSRAKVYDEIMKEGKGAAAAREEGRSGARRQQRSQGRSQRQGRDPGVLGLPVPVLQARRAHRPGDRKRVRQQDQDRVASHAAAVPQERAASSRGDSRSVRAEGLRGLLDVPRQAVRRRRRRRSPHRSREPREDRPGDRAWTWRSSRAALDSNKHKAKIDADTEAGNKAGINGTPAFVINGYYISGAQPEAAFKKLINRALKEAEGK